MVASHNLNKALLLIALVCLLFLPLSADSLWWREVFNSGHTILFIIVSLILYSHIDGLQKDTSQLTVCLLVLVTGLTLGVLIEVMQGMMQREASYTDLAKDFYGLMSGLMLALFLRKKLKLNRYLLIVVSFVFLVLGTSSLIQLSWHYLQRNNALPVLLAFDENWSTSFLHFKNSELLGISGTDNNDGVAFHKVRFDSGQYPGVSIIEPEEDWSAYRALRFTVFSANKENIELYLRVHDNRHDQDYADRFNQRYLVQPGLNDIEVKISRIQNAPYSRKLDMKNIAGFELFLINNKEPLFLEVSNIFLVM